MAVVCHGITKTFGSGEASVQALRGVDLEVKEGELCMIVGPSGSGKTTLISIIAGILAHDEGSCEILGHDVHAMDVEEKIRFRGKNIGFVFQAFNLIPMLNATENISIPLLLNNVPIKEAGDTAGAFLEKLGMGDKKNAYPRELSGGQQQRIAIARACIHNPRIIVCDEPTSNLDHKTGKNVMEVLRRYALEEHRTLLVVTHDARIFEFADSIISLEDGKVVQTSHES